jgi:hypothetical protein
MNRKQREELEQSLAQARRLAAEPSDSLTRDRLVSLVEESELEL